jgi:FKBP-type peptidyl-prolyl cis-trans isomerase FklB
MMKFNLALIAWSAAGLLAAQAAGAETSPVLRDQQDKSSYSIGVQIGSGVRQQMQQQGLQLKPDLVAAGFKDAFSGSKLQLADEDIRQALSLLEREMVGKHAEVAEKNKKDGAAFLAENKKKPGVKTLPSGLQYQVLKDGTGPKPKLTDTVKANYKGTLIDGTVFDSSEKQGQPVSFPCNGVIAGWTEALQLMSVGSKWRLFIPSDLAYKDQGAGPLIGPNATLIFDVELLAIETGAKALN